MNTVGNLGSYVGPNIPIWVKQIPALSSNPSAALCVIAGLLMIGAFLTFFFIPKSLRVRIGG